MAHLAVIYMQHMQDIACHGGHRQHAMERLTAAHHLPECQLHTTYHECVLEEGPAAQLTQHPCILDLEWM